MPEAPPRDELGDDELAQSLAAQFKANELRRWMSANGLERSRGANKLESAEQAVEQDRDGIYDFLVRTSAIEHDWAPKCVYHEACGNRTAGPNTEVCDECMDVQAADASADGDPPGAPFDDETEYMRALHREYGD